MAVAPPDTQPGQNTFVNGRGYNTGSTAPGPVITDGPNGAKVSQNNGQVTPSNPAAPPVAGSDWTSDPIYQLVLGQQQLAIRQAQSAALTAETQALIAYGDSALALAVTGDPQIAAAAGANKASTLAQLAAQNTANVRNVNDTENQNNLFYSSDRGYQLGLAQQAYLNSSANELGKLQGNLGNIQAQLLAQEQQSYQEEQKAASDAYNRAISNPVGSPASSGASGVSVKPSGGTTPLGAAVKPQLSGPSGVVTSRPTVTPPPNVSTPGLVK